jgi:predicted permease
MFLLRDLRYGIRILLRAPVPTAVAILALALGIGVNLTSFASLNAIILHPFSFPRLDRIVTLWETPLKAPEDRQQFAPANYVDLQEQGKSFSEVAAYRESDVNLTGAGEPVRVEAAEVTSSFFELLGGKAALGRVFSVGDSADETGRTAVISNGFWKSKLAGTRQAIGKRILLDGKAYTVVGVMPEDFDYPLSNQIWTALQLTPQEKGERTLQSLQLLGLLKPGTSVEQCRAEARQISRRQQVRYPASDEGLTIEVLPMSELPDQATARFEFLLLACATFVLLLAAANVGNLQVARATGRMRELAVRAALGASRLHMLRQLLAEGLLLAAAGGVCGLLLASWNLSMFKAKIPADVLALVPGLRTMHVDTAVMNYTLVISLAAGLLASLPAMLQLLRQSGGMDLNERLRSSGCASGYSAGLNRMQSCLIGFEVAMALVLLVGAAFLVKAFDGILAGSYGYNPDHVLELQISLPAVRYDSDAKLVNFYDRVLDRLHETAGTRSAAVWTGGPDVPLAVAGRPAPRPGDVRAQRNVVSADYLSAMGVPLREGRFFSGAERPDSLRVAVLSASVAKRYWPNSDPIGQRLRFGSSDSPWITVIGVSGDIVWDWLTKEPAPADLRSVYPVPAAIGHFGDPDGGRPSAFWGHRAGGHPQGGPGPAGLCGEDYESLPRGADIGSSRRGGQHEAVCRGSAAARSHRYFWRDRLFRCTAHSRDRSSYRLGREYGC